MMFIITNNFLKSQLYQGYKVLYFWLMQLTLLKVEHIEVFAFKLFRFPYKEIKRLYFIYQPNEFCQWQEAKGD